MAQEITASPLSPPLEIGLNAAIVAVENQTPEVLAVGSPELVQQPSRDGLPFGPFDPLAHRTFEIGLRSWVAEQTGLSLGYVEQLYTFGDRGRHMRQGDEGPHVVSVGYLALTRPRTGLSRARGTHWRSWYDYFPWEDWRDGRPAMVDAVIMPRIEAWGRGAAQHSLNSRSDHMARIGSAFGVNGVVWDEEKVLERYELMYASGLVAEAATDGRVAAETVHPLTGRAMQYDHRRILATAISRLRAKIKYRPVVFELMPPSFSLTDLQVTVEAISGRPVHKQNFRRLVEAGALVEPTGETRQETGGRPAKLFRFRHEVLQERPAPGVRLGKGV